MIKSKVSIQLNFVKRLPLRLNSIIFKITVNSMLVCFEGIYSFELTGHLK